MKINTISAYVLVYLLARGHWNLMVPVRAVEESDANSSASASADGGLTAGGSDADGSGLAAPAAPEGSSASPDAGSTAGDGSGVAVPAEGASSGDASTDADATDSSSSHAAAEEKAEVSTDDDAGQVKAGEVLLNGLYPDLFTSGLYSHKEHGETKPELVAKRQETLLLAEKARKAAEDLRKAAEKLSKEADELTKAVEDNVKLEDDVNLVVLRARIDAFDQKVGIEMKKADDIGKDLDMTYYSGFPDGWHKRVDHEVLKKMYRERKLTDNLMYYSGFPDGWHRLDEGALQDIRRYKIKLEAVEVKAMIDAKMKEIDRVKKQIDDLTAVYNLLDNELKKLEAEHKELENKLLGLDASLIKLYKADADGNLVELLENTDFEKRKAQGDIRFLFKPNVECTLVKYGDHELWKKGERDVDVPKLVAFNDTVNVIAVRDDGRAVLYKKETNSDKWNYHTTVERQQRGTGVTRTAAQTGSAAHTGSSAAPAPGTLTSGLSASKLELDNASTGTPETAELLEAEETASVASGEGSETNEANESESSSALRGSTSSSGEGLAGEGSAASDYSSVFMD